MRSASRSPNRTPDKFEEMIKEIRPELYRYVTRMIGSVIDSEDVVQEALVKAYYSLSTLAPESNLRGWLFRIAHNKAIDHLRRYDNQPMEHLDEHHLFAEPDQPLEEKELSAIALSVFLKLTPKQRSCVILKDVLDYSLAEISELLDATVPEIKAALHRGRTRLREMAKSVAAESPVVLDEHEKELLSRYVARFNARDFDAVRDMLADEVQLDLIGRTKMKGAAEVSNIYFHNYSQTSDWQFGLGIVAGKLAIVAYDPHEAAPEPAYFVLIAWNGSQVSGIRDYRYARYVMRDAAIAPL